MKLSLLLNLFVAFGAVSSSHAETLPVIEKNECVVNIPASRMGRKSLIKNSEISGQAAVDEMTHAAAQGKKMQYLIDIMGQQRAVQFQDVIASANAAENPDDSYCSPVNSATLYRQCAAGEALTAARCRTVCEQSRYSPDCR